MTFNTKVIFPTLASVLALVQVSPLALAESANVPAGGHLQTQFTGSNKCLDIVNDGKNNQLTMADCGNFSGQFWSIQAAGQGSYRLQTQFTGNNKCLDIVNDGKNNQLTMADCGNFSGQFWSIAGQPGSYRLQTQFTGKNKCLDIVNDGTNNRLIMADCGNFSGQMWTILTQ